eukprot:TRINITY_DN3243_c0_g1_i1.p1 TRINITY_DN3243_c0_g1~~TRINITY_DN3243_c0_g1_i1.p1  ORF type:complete len:424 (-),score=56.97 TRINITY_DN3243_c0_g1_i1:37-1308(-)
MDTTLLDATTSGNLMVVQQYVSNTQTPLDSPLPGCSYGETMLHNSAYYGHEELVIWLLQNGANPNSVGIHSGSTPLHSAASGGQIGICAILILYGSNVNATTSTGWTPIDCANNKHLSYCVAFLKQRGGKFSKTKETISELTMTNPSTPVAKPTHAITVDNLLVNGDLHIQIASDLHIEFYGDQKIPDDIISPSAPILALCGDIGIPALNNFERFILRQCERFALVLYICGNHEFYNSMESSSIYQTDAVKKILYNISSKQSNFIFMDKGFVNIGSFCILGTTLWCEVPENYRESLANNLNDYNLIFTENKKLTPSKSHEWFISEKEWLEQEITKSKSRNQKCVVLTHHAPSFQISGSGVGWASNLEHLFKDNGSNVEAWIYGHTHYNFDRMINGTRVVSNQRGYIPNVKKSYQLSKVIKIRK